MADVSVYTRSCSIYMPMHDVTPKVVAIAVRMVMTTCKTLLQISFFSMIF